MEKILYFHNLEYNKTRKGKEKSLKGDGCHVQF